MHRTLATCSADHTVKLWSTEEYDFTLLKTLTGHQKWVWDAAFSADSAYLVTGQSSYYHPLSPAHASLARAAPAQSGYMHPD